MPSQGYTAETSADHIKVDFSAMSWSGVIDALYTYNKGEYIKLNPNGFTKTRNLQYSGPAPFTLFTKSINEKGIEVFEPSIQLPQVAAMQSPFILLLRTGEDYKGYAYDENASNFKQGEYRFVNLTEVDLGVKVGDDVKKIASTEDVSIRPRNADLHQVLGVVLAADTATGWRQVYSISWEFNPKIRTLVFIYMNKHGQYRMRRIDERMP